MNGPEKPVVDLMAPLKRLLARFPLSGERKVHPTPPDTFHPFDHSDFDDQQCLLNLLHEHSPIFQGNTEGRLTTYVFGHRRIRRLLGERKTGLPCETIDLRKLFPEGSVRAMDGSTHADYKRKLVRAIEAVSLREHESAFRQTIRDCLDAIEDIATASVTLEGAAPHLRAAASTLMIRVLFGIDSASEKFAPLRDAYVRFSPDEPVQHIGSKQIEAFRDLRALLGDEIRDMARGGNRFAPSSMLKQMLESGNLDETLLGNLIYLHEPSHFDSFSLWRWIIYYLAKNENVAAQLRRTRAEETRRLANAIVLETLRLDQSEGLIRQVTEGFDFDGIRIPEGTYLRACIWEGHKDPDKFPQPFSFDPGRFLGEPLTPDVYAPFGLDQHRCIGAELEAFISSIFVEELTHRFDIRIVDERPHFRGLYHWQPNPQTRLRFRSAV